MRLPLLCLLAASAPAAAAGATVVTATHGYIIDAVPSGFAPAGAFVQSAPDTGGWLQVWAAPDATRTSGDWVALATAGLPGAPPRTRPGRARPGVRPRPRPGRRP